MRILTHPQSTTFKRICNIDRGMITNVLCLLIGIGIGIALVGFPILILSIRKKEGVNDSEVIAHHGVSKMEGKLQKSELEEKIDFIYDFLKTRGIIRELGDFTGTYAQFIDHVEEEIKVLEGGTIRGPEAFRRQRLLEFSLSMALVYAKVRGDAEMIPKIEKWWKKAKSLH